MNKNCNPVIIALCGKGGVGKTSISASIVKILSENRGNRVLAIDADPAVGLSTALGIEVKKTVDDIRKELIRRVEQGDGGDKQEMVSRLDYEMLSALEERENLAFLAIGRPEQEGCYCQVNHILKDIIASMAGNFDFVVIDGEAGIEQVNRRVMEHVSHLLLVSDVSAKGLKVVETICDISKTAIDCEKHGLIVNKVRGEEEMKRVSYPQELNCLGWVPEDDIIRNFDIEAKSILETPECASVNAVKNCISLMGIKV